MRGDLKGPIIMSFLLETIPVIIHPLSYMYVHKIKKRLIKNTFNEISKCQNNKATLKITAIMFYIQDPFN